MPVSTIGSVGLVGAGAMGTALGAGWRAGGARVVTTLAGRSERTRGLVAAAGIDTVPTLTDLVAADLVVSVVPPGAALSAARAIATAALAAGRTPLVADLNAVAPDTVRGIAATLDAAGLRLVDGSISGGPPRPERPTRVYLSGPDAGRIVALPAPWLDIVDLGPDVGRASALKMCTASMYKGSRALIISALLAADRHGVLAEFLADTAREWPDNAAIWPADVALAASKADRYVAEMHEIARTQAAAGLPAALFRGVGAAYARAAGSALGRATPEDAAARADLDEVLAALAPLAPDPSAGRPAGVLFDFSGTLFHIEPAAQLLLGALGPDAVSRAPAVVAAGGINGSDDPPDLPDLPAAVAAVWEHRDLSAADHHAAYTAAAQRGGLSADEADAVYRRGIGPDAWLPYPDTVATLRDLAAAGVPVAVVSNIGWDPRPVLARYGVDRDIGVLMLSYEQGVQKPDPEIFRRACAALGIAPADAVMVGDNPYADGGASALGIRFAAVEADPGRAPDALRRAVGLDR